MFTDYTSELIKALSSLNITTLSHCSSIIQDAYENNRRLIFLGNGGSASTASHCVADFQKNIGLKDKKFEVLALTDSPSLLTAWGNDTVFDNIFSGQLETWCRPKDIVILISGSGNSPNVIKAVKTVRELEGISIGFSGISGGELAEISDISIVVNSMSMQIVEDVHLSICHMLFLSLSNSL